MKTINTLLTLFVLFCSTFSFAYEGATYQLVPASSTLETGDVIIIAAFDNNGTIAVMTETAYNNGLDGLLVPSNEKAKVSTTESNKEATMPQYITIPSIETGLVPVELTVSKNSNGNVNLKNGSKYLSNSSSSNLALNTTCTNWMINYSDANPYSSTNGVRLSNPSNSYSTIMYSPSESGKDNDYFKTYQNTTTNEDNNIACCYKKVSTVSFTLSQNGYTTLCYSDKALVVPEGMKAYTFQLTSENKLTNLDTFNAGDIIPKNTAVLVKGTPNTTYNIIYDESYSAIYANASQNALSGETDAKNKTTGGSKYYMFSNGKNGLGFYWGAYNGAAFENGANKAYLRISSPSSAKAIFFTLPDDDDITGTPQITTNVDITPTLSYDLIGRKVTPSYRGITIKGGKKYIK